jgi:soluble lytic murein transglycosylase-like protein
MATLIDALVITLGLDSTAFKAGQKETAEGLKKTADQSTQVAKLMEEQGKKAASFFSQIKNELLALVGITLSIKGMKDLVVGTADSMATLGRSAAALRMSARDLDAWQHTAMAFGGTADELTSSMQSLNDSLYAFAMGKGGGDAVAALNSLGISAVDATGKAKSMGEIYKEVGEQFRARHFDVGTARQYGSALGMTGNIVNMELASNEESVHQEMYKHSGVSDEAVAKSQQFQETWAKIDQTFQSVREKLFTALIPYIEQLLTQLDKFATWVSTHQTEINGFFTTAAADVKAVTDAVGGVQNAFELLLAYVAGRWLLGIVAAAGAAAKAIGGVSTATGGGLKGGLPVLGLALAGWKVNSDLNDIEAEAKGKNVTPAHLLMMKKEEEDKKGVAFHDEIIKKVSSWWEGVKTNTIEIPSNTKVNSSARTPEQAAAEGGSYLDPLAQALLNTAKSTDKSSKDLTDSAEQHAQAARRIKNVDVPGAVTKQFNDTVDALNNQSFAQKFTDAVVAILQKVGMAQPQSPVALGDDVGLPQAKGAGKVLLDMMGAKFTQLETQLGLPAGILRRIATAESGGNQFAVSPAGAQGLMQLMPGTAQMLGLRGGDVFDPDKSAQAAARYLRQLLSMFGGDITKAVAAYNEGPGALQRKGMGNLPHETVDYINRVLGGVRVGAGASAMGAPSPLMPSTSTSEVNINNLNVVTQATDAQGIARDLPSQIRRNSLVAAANGGSF